MASSPYINRFLQPDSLIPGVANPQSWNRYSYVSNNPIRLNDPTGHQESECGEGGSECGGSGGNGGPPPPIPPTNPPSGGGSGGGGGGASGGGGCNAVCQLNNELKGVVDPLYDIFGSNSDTGCNTYLLWNGNSWCHDNEFTQVACYFCSTKQALDYNLRFAYPLQYNNPIPAGTKRTDGWVVGGDFFPEGYSGPTDGLRALGHVWVKNEGYTTTNYTYPSHIFHQGTIVQTISEGPHGSSLITVNGQGENSTPWVAAANQWGGPVAFRATDALMLIYATTDQIINAIP